MKEKRHVFHEGVTMNKRMAYGVLLTVLVPSLSVQGFTITQVTNNDYWDTNPRISGSNVVWVDNEEASPKNINFFDGTSITKVGFGEDPDVSEPSVVWENEQIFWYDGTSVHQLTNSGGSPARPRISGNYIVWIESAGNTPSGPPQIMLYDIATGTTLQITNDPLYNYKTDPAVSGTRVVWGAEYKIDYYDILTGQTGTIVELGDTWIDQVAISGDNVVWGDGTRVWLYDGTSTTYLGDGANADVSDSYVVWAKGYALYFYDIAAGQTHKLTDLTAYPSNPRISGSTVVWSATDGHDPEIYMATIPEPASLLLFLGVGVAILRRVRP